MNKSVLIIMVFVTVVNCAHLRKQVHIYEPVDTTHCKDRHLWVADGSWDCSGLLPGGRGGFYNNPGRWCNHYVLTDCCETCAYLRKIGTIGPKVIG